MRFVGLDLLRGIAAFGIVGCHLLLMSRTECAWRLTSLCDMNVAIFAALSGYVMAFEKWNGWGQYVKKRAIRILPTYLVWSVVFLFFSAAFQFISEGKVNPRYGDIKWWCDVFVWGASATHLWFLSTLFYAQVLLSLFFKRWPGRHWIALSLVLIMATVFSNNTYVTYQVRLLGFLMLGSGLASFKQDSLVCYRWPILLVAAILLVAYCAAYSLHVGYLKDWMTVGPVLLAFVAFSGSISGKFAAVGTFLGATSMGVYLIHPLFTKAFGLIVARLFPQPYGVGAVLFDWVMSWLAALLLTVVFLRIPKISRVMK